MTTSAAKAGRNAEIVDRLEAENERLRAALSDARCALKTIRVENDRAKRQFTNVSNKLIDDAVRGGLGADEQKAEPERPKNWEDGWPPFDK